MVHRTEEWHGTEMLDIAPTDNTPYTWGMSLCVSEGFPGLWPKTVRLLAAKEEQAAAASSEKTLGTGDATGGYHEDIGSKQEEQDSPCKSQPAVFAPDYADTTASISSQAVVPSRGTSAPKRGKSGEPSASNLPPTKRRK